MPLTFSCTPTHGIVPWTASISGTLTDGAGAGIPNVAIYFQTSLDNGITWIDMFGTSYWSTDASGNYTVAIDFTTENGWVAGVQQPIRAHTIDYGDSNPVTVIMDSASPVTSLTFSVSPTHGIVPWTAQISGTLLANGIGVPSATVVIETTEDGINWIYTGVSFTTDAGGAYGGTFEFLAINGWFAGVSQPLRATFAGDVNYNPSTSNQITVTMDSLPSALTVQLSASRSNGTVNATATVSGGISPYTVDFLLNEATNVGHATNVVTTATTSYIENTTHNLKATATDSLSATGSSNTVSVPAVTPPPPPNWALLVAIGFGVTLPAFYIVTRKPKHKKRRH